MVMHLEKLRGAFLCKIEMNGERECAIHTMEGYLALKNSVLCKNMF